MNDSKTLAVAAEKTARKDALLILLLSGVLFFTSLGSRDLWNPNEPIYGRAVVEMWERSDWLIPTVNGKVFAEKPILYYWTALGFSHLLGGIDEFSLRIPSALAGMLSVWLTYLLVLPYVGRRQALLTAALFASCYQVFWASRSVQMDILVLASTLGTLLPLLRMVDFGMSPVRAWLLAGAAAGLGFASKGPVTWIVPGVFFFGYILATSRPKELVRPQILLGAGAAIAVGSPWYLTLLAQGETAFLYEALIRQNFGRFVSAWDHDQPWWYFLKYFWLDYAPWAFFAPAAFFLRPRDTAETRLHRLGWVWIVAVIFFFSLSDSKRAPYILPIAPAAAILGAGVFAHFERGEHRDAAHRLALIAFSFFGLLFLAAGPAAVVYSGEIPPELKTHAAGLAVVMMLAGFVVLGGVLLHRRRPRLAPYALLTGTLALYLFAAAAIFPAMNQKKSARDFARRLQTELTARPDSALATYRFWNWRSGYHYYAERNMIPLKSPEELRLYWQEHPNGYLLVEAPHYAEVLELSPVLVKAHAGKIGSRTAYLLRIEPSSIAASDQIASIGLDTP